MRTIFVVTHPESAHHVEKRVGGWFDTGLTKRGQAQAGAIAQALLARIGSRPVEIVSSDLLRASETADTIADLFRTGITVNRDLRDISYGAAEGRPQDWLDLRHESIPDDDRLDYRNSMVGGETRREVATRIYGAMDTIMARPCDCQIVVTHGFALTFVVAKWIGMPIPAAGWVAFRAPSGSITHLEQDDLWQSRALVSLGDVAHLEAGAD
ncbi:putative phosphoglycerate mutase [Rhizobium sp. PP-F2F-G48]|uniref:histidine phosphatase family protein n=1 Tax=Rhizobium sp. PP-F2F-G48 TaxID=2135651 RepID=UPI0010515526|nr:histidine phosphatase family protein [Rhizobium sp. PP-F2F-G48]TCM56251.1 putative phosphoglycerate mutase [Rhizobium sp. PP-F2F-G48]